MPDHNMLPQGYHSPAHYGNEYSNTNSGSPNSSAAAPVPMPYLPLARGWQEAKDDQNRTYYYNEATKQRSWTRPVSPPSVGAGTGSSAMQLIQSMQQLNLSTAASTKPVFSPAAYVERYGPHISSDNIRSFDRKGRKVGDCRNHLHDYILKNCNVNRSMLVLGGPGVGKTYLMKNLPSLVADVNDPGCLTDDNAFYENVRSSAKAGLPTTACWITAPFVQAIERVSERGDSPNYDLMYQAESHVTALDDFNDCCNRLKKYNIHPIAIVNPENSDQSNPFASLKTFEGKEAVDLASGWVVGQNEKYN